MDYKDYAKKHKIDLKTTVREDLMEQYEFACHFIAGYFVKKYFGKSVDYYDDCSWINDDIGTVLYVNEFYFNLTEMYEYIKHKYGVENMFEHYNYALNCRERGRFPVDIKNYKIQTRSKKR